jgi:alcohol dehydrogenase, propanol-preferring
LLTHGVILDEAHRPARLTLIPTMACLDAGGTAVLAGIHMTPIPALDYGKHLYGERDIHPVTANTRQDGRELLAEAALARVRPRVTVYPLQQANQALQNLKAGRIDGTAVLSVAW